MARKDPAIPMMSHVLYYLDELTYAWELRDAIQGLWNGELEPQKSFWIDRKQETETLIHEIQDSFLSFGFHVSSQEARHFGWFLLMIPLDEEFIKNINYGQIFPFLENALDVLMLECLERRILKRGQEASVYKCLRETAWKVCSRYKGHGPKHGAAHLYSELTESSIAERFALSCIAFFNWRAKNDLKKRVGETESLKEYAPFGRVQDEGYSLLKRGFKKIDSWPDADDITPDGFWVAVEEDLAEHHFEYTTCTRQRSEFQRFWDATRLHRVPWAYEDRDAKIEMEMAALKTEAEEMGDSREDNAFLLAHLDFEEEIGIGFLGKELSEDEWHARAIRESRLAKQGRGGLLRLRYNWDSPRAISPERICAFIGWLGRSKSLSELVRSEDKEGRFSGYCLLALLEGLQTGAGLGQILTGERPLCLRVNVRPAGLYLSLEEAAELFSDQRSVRISTDDVWNFWLKIRKKFSNEHPEFAFGKGSVVATGRAWLIERCGFNPVETSHISGVFLPGSKATAQYMEINEPTERLHHSSQRLLKMLQRVARNARIPWADAKVKRYLENAQQLLLEYQNELSKIRKKRRSLWQNRKPYLRIAREAEIEKAMKLLIDRTSQAESRNRKKNASAMMLGFIRLCLGLRPGEAEQKGYGWVSFVLALLVITGKGNRGFAEDRAIPIPHALLSLLAKYSSLFREKSVLKHRICQWQERPFIAWHSPGPILASESEAKKLLKQALLDTGIPPTGANYGLRRYFITTLYRMGIPHDHIQALAGHNQEGFEFLGFFSRGTAPALRRSVEKYTKTFNPLIQKALKALENGTVQS